MPFVGEIKSRSECPAIDRDRWHALVDSHPALAHVPPLERIGKNPRTGAPMVFRAPASFAIVEASGERVASINWAMDESAALLVYLDDNLPDKAEFVTKIAQEVAAALSASYVAFE